MTGILLTAASIGAMCAAGITVSAVFQWLHNFEFDMSKKSKKQTGGNHYDKIESVSKKIRPNNHL